MEFINEILWGSFIIFLSAFASLTIYMSVRETSKRLNKNPFRLLFACLILGVLIITSLVLLLILVRWIIFKNF